MYADNHLLFLVGVVALLWGANLVKTIKNPWFLRELIRPVKTVAQKARD